MVSLKGTSPVQMNLQFISLFALHSIPPWMEILSPPPTLPTLQISTTHFGHDRRVFFVEQQRLRGMDAMLLLLLLHYHCTVIVVSNILKLGLPSR